MSVVDLAAARTLGAHVSAASEALNLRLTLTVDEAADVLGVSRDVAYRCVESGDIPSLRLGRRIVVPTAKLLALLGVDERSA